MLKVESIQNGVVIDHIPVGQGMNIYQLLDLDSNAQSIALLQSVKSHKYGLKDLIKIEGTTLPERLDILGYLNKQITLIIIKDGKVEKKYHPIPPLHYKHRSKLRSYIPTIFYRKISLSIL